MKILRDKKGKRLLILVVATMLVTSTGGCAGCAGCNTNTTPATNPTTAVTATVAPTAEPTAEVVPTIAPTVAPEVTDAVEPTEAITPTEVPAITEEVQPTDVPEVTEAPVATPTEEPAPTAEPTATPIPTATVAPTSTPEPTPTCTPEPTATPVPTPTPKPTATPKPTPSPTPTPEVVNGITAGDYVTFGSYEQDANLGNGKEPIEWLVLEVKDGKAFLLSKYVLDAQPYDSRYDIEEHWAAVTAGKEYDFPVRWEDYELRQWLNGVFYNAAFDTTEQNGILLSKVENLPNSLRGTDSGPDTKDRVYLLSESEALKYFDRELILGDVLDNAPEDKRHLGVPTAYAQEQGLDVSPNASYWPKHFTTWSLRTTGGWGSHNVYLLRSGFMMQDGAYVTGYGGIRPCMWVDLTIAEVEK